MINPKILFKKIDLKYGLPKKIDGPVEKINYENKMPLSGIGILYCKFVRSKT